MRPLYLKEDTIDFINDRGINHDIKSVLEETPKQYVEENGCIKLTLFKNVKPISVDDAIKSLIKRVETPNLIKERINKGVYTMENGNKVILNTPMKRMKAKTSVFFILYNSVNYFDKQFGCGTYLDEVISYLIAFKSDCLEDYGTFVDFIPNPEEYETTHVDFDYYDYIQKRQSVYKGNFVFKDKKTMTNVIKSANALLCSQEVVSATKDLSNQLIQDPDLARATIVKQVGEIAKNINNSNRDRLEAYRLLSNLLGIEKPVVQTNVDITLQGIDNALNMEDYETIIDEEKRK
jgi:hypothetical protein